MSRSARRNRIMSTMLMSQVAFGDEPIASIKATIKGRHAHRREMAAKFRRAIASNKGA